MSTVVAHIDHLVGNDQVTVPAYATFVQSTNFNMRMISKNESV